MPLFFIIAIAAGGIAVGATAVDVTSDTRAARTQAQAATFDPTPYGTAADCQAAASRAGAPASACNGKI
jgi:hypothetical protein